MSNQPNSSVYSEKKIAAYESLFKESSFAKPQEVYLTITVAHLFGQAYIMEQQGTKEGDPVYSRFVCNLEDITKVYINDNVKASPLFIQCDTDVKGVVHRKRIIVPCLENVASIVEQIKEVQALHMEKYEAAQEREKQKKRQQLEEARMKEQIQHEAKEKIPPLPVVEKIKIDDKIDKKLNELEKPKSDKKVIKAEEVKSEPKPAKKISESAKAMNDEALKALKELERIEINVAKPVAKPEKAEPVKLDIAEIASIESIADSLPAAPASTKKAEIKDEIEGIEETDAVPAPVPKAPEAQLEVLDLEAALEAAKNAPAKEEKKVVKEEVDPITSINKLEKAAPVEKAEKPAEVKPVVEKKKPAPMPVRVNPNGAASSLSDFESAILELKTKKDNGEISAEAFAEEKKKLLASLY